MRGYYTDISSTRNRNSNQSPSTDRPHPLYSLSDDADMGYTLHPLENISRNHDLDNVFVINGDIYEPSVSMYEETEYDVDNPAPSSSPDTDSEEDDGDYWQYYNGPTDRHLRHHSNIYCSSDTVLIFCLLVFLMMIIIIAMGIHIVLKND